MREIKFKAWNDRDKKWMHIYLNSATANEVAGWCNLEWYQYIGLKDKAGREIYEGDFIKIADHDEFCPEDDFVCLVKWNNEMALYAPNYSLTSEHHSAEVIGNICENPELLAQGGEL